MAQHEHGLVLVGYKGRHAVCAQVGAYSDGIGAQIVKDRARVGHRRVADIAPLGIQQHRDSCWDRSDHGLERVCTLGAMLFEKSAVWLVAADQVTGLLR